jgi:hypothetical protein
VLAGVAVAVLFVLLAHLRLHTLVAAAWAVALASWFGVRRHRVVRGAGAAVLLLSVPWLLGVGPAGMSLVLDSSGTLEARRANNAVGAVTAVVPPSHPAATATPTPPHPAPDDALGANVRYLPKGLSVMLIEPLPWKAGASRAVDLARVETLVWWPLLGLAAIGIVGSRRRLRVLAFPILTAGAIVVLYALSEGNFGTAYRHRGEVVWAVVLLAGAGVDVLQTRRLARAAGSSAGAAAT